MKPGSAAIEAAIQKKTKYQPLIILKISKPNAAETSSACVELAKLNINDISRGLLRPHTSRDTLFGFYNG